MNLRPEPTHEHVLLSEADRIHHVAVRRIGSEWLQVVATFFDRDRAEKYAEVENDIAVDDAADGRGPRNDVVEPPNLPEPPSVVRREFFRPATAPPARAEPVPATEPASPPPAPVAAAVAPPVAIEAAYARYVDTDIASEESAAAAVTPAPEAQATAGEAAAEQGAGAKPETVEAPAPVPPDPVVADFATAAATPAPRPRESTAKPTPKPVSPLVEALRKSPPAPRPLTSLREGEVAVHAKPKSITSLPVNGRDPMLMRAEEQKKAPVMHSGSSADQLADQLVADLPKLMDYHPRGISADELAEFYKVPYARARDAMVKMFARREGRLIRHPGKTAQRLVPPDWVDTEKPHDYHAAVLGLFRKEALADGTVQISLAAIAQRTGVPQGGMGLVIGDLIARKAIEIAARAPQGTKVPHTYRVLGLQA